MINYRVEDRERDDENTFQSAEHMSAEGLVGSLGTWDLTDGGKEESNHGGWITRHLWGGGRVRSGRARVEKIPLRWNLWVKAHLSNKKTTKIKTTGGNYGTQVRLE